MAVTVAQAPSLSLHPTTRSWAGCLHCSTPSPPFLLTLLGGVVFTVSLFGCCGAIRESHGLTRTFTLLLAVIFLTEMAVVLGVYHCRDQVTYGLEDGYF